MGMCGAKKVSGVAAGRFLAMIRLRLNNLLVEALIEKCLLEVKLRCRLSLWPGYGLILDLLLRVMSRTSFTKLFLRRCIAVHSSQKNPWPFLALLG